MSVLPCLIDVLDTTWYDSVCQWHAPGTPISFTNTSAHHVITESVEIGVKNPHPKPLTCM
jgi:hypothetical protein